MHQGLEILFPWIKFDLFGQKLWYNTISLRTALLCDLIFRDLFMKYLMGLNF